MQDRLAIGTSLTLKWPRAVPLDGLRWAFINAGDSRWGVHHFDAMVQPVRPHTLFIEFSINDCRGCIHLTPQGATELTAWMVRRAHALGVQRVFLMTMNDDCVGLPAVRAERDRYELRWRKPVEPYYHGYRLLAERMPPEFGVRLIDVKRRWDALPPDLVAQLIPDGVHPTVEAYRQVLAPVVMEAVEQHGG